VPLPRATSAFVVRNLFQITLIGEYVKIVEIAVSVPVFAWRDCRKERKS